MHDGIHLALNTAPELESMDLVCIKDTALWCFSDMGQSCTLTSCRVHTFSRGQDGKFGYLDKPSAFLAYPCQGFAPCCF